MSDPQANIVANQSQKVLGLRLSSIFLGTTNLLFLTYIYGLLFFDTPEYFSFNDLATSSLRDIHVFGAIIRLLLPLVVGFGIGRLSPGEPVREATVTGFLASLLLCWPGIFFPRLRTYFVGDDNLATQPLKLLMIYAVFMGSYSALARFGAIAGFHREKLSRGVFNLSFWKKVDRYDATITIILGLLTNVIWEILLRVFK